MNKEPSQVKKSKDEILMQVCNITDKEEWSYVEHITPIQALKAMEEYRSQASELPSDEDIEKEANYRFTTGHGATDHYSVDVFINACKWLNEKHINSIAARDTRIKELEEALKISEEIVSELNRGYNRFM